MLWNTGVPHRVVTKLMLDEGISQCSLFDYVHASYVNAAVRESNFLLPFQIELPSPLVKMEMTLPQWAWIAIKCQTSAPAFFSARLIASSLFSHLVSRYTTRLIKEALVSHFLLL
jgi:hypothetical protein